MAGTRTTKKAAKTKKPVKKKAKASRPAAKKSSAKKKKAAVKKKKATTKKAKAKTPAVKKKVAAKNKSSKKAVKKTAKKATAQKKSVKKAAKKKVVAKKKATPAAPSKAKAKAKSKAVPASGGTTSRLRAAVKRVKAKVKQQGGPKAVASGKLGVGSKAPQFSLSDRAGKVHKLAEVKSDYIVVFFYPRDDTPGCTRESKGFSRDLEKFRKLSTTLFGISGGDAASKDRFCRKHNLKVTLLADPDYKVAEKFGAYGEKSFMGRKYMGVLRRTYVLDKAGKILRVFDKVKPEDHSKEVREYIKTLDG